MRWHVFAVGKPKLEFARLGVEEYASRLRPFAPVTFTWLKASTPSGEGMAMLERSKTAYRIVLDERGEHVTSRGLAKKITHCEMHASRDVALLIGGADGLADEVRHAANWLWALSELTLQHEFALLLALEQVYRAYTIKAGLPYHRE